LRWAAYSALAREKSYWAVATRAELAMLEGERDAALDDYREAAALAVASRDRFALDSSSQTLELLQTLRFRPDIVTEAARVLDAGEQQLDALLGARPKRPAEPARVVLFSGHMIDKPGRGTARFPENKANAAGARIAQELDALGVGAGDLGISQAASGGDLLFARACLKRDMRLEIYLPEREPEFLAASVSFADRHWQRDYETLRDHGDVLFRIMPDELGPPPEGIDVYDRCNLWVLHSALSCGLSKVSFMTLWDGKPGDGPGGTEHMALLVQRLTGRQPVIIDPAEL
jgi:hypothetical protein